MNKLDTILKRFPQHTYNKDDINSALGKLVSAFAEEFNITMSNIDRVDKMLGIDTVLPEDIYDRFGVLLNISKSPAETGEQYRNRLKVSIAALSGGTKEAIKYAVASGLSIIDDQYALDRINVYDAWEYTGEATISGDYGYVVCEVDLNNNTYSTDIEEVIADSANRVKATGVAIQFIYRNFRVVYYVELDSISYGSLSTMIYGQVGER